MYIREGGKEHRKSRGGKKREQENNKREQQEERTRTREEREDEEKEEGRDPLAIAHSEENSIEKVEGERRENKKREQQEERTREDEEKTKDETHWLSPTRSFFSRCHVSMGRIRSCSPLLLYASCIALHRIEWYDCASRRITYAPYKFGLVSLRERCV